MRSAIVVIVLCFGGAAAWGDALVVETAEGQVNSHTNLVQRQAAVACAPAGSCVVVWSSATSAGDDEALDSIHAQRYDAAGYPYGGELEVNTHTTGAQWRPAVAIAPNGDFVVVWESETGPVGEDASWSSIRMRAFDSAGNQLFAERQVNEYTSGAQTVPAVAWAGAQIVVVWQSPAATGDISQESIQARGFSAAGAALGPQFLVNATTAGLQAAPAIAGYPGSGFVVAWGADEDPSGTTDFRVRARRVTATAASGGEIVVDAAPGRLATPAVDLVPMGIAVAWDHGDDGDFTGIRARLFDGAGTALGAAFPVNDLIDNEQLLPTIAWLPSTDVAVVWQSDSSNDTDVSSRSIQMRLFDRTGSPLAEQQQVNVFWGNPQDAPAAAAARDVGRLTIVWESNGSYGTDDSLLSVQRATYVTSPPTPLFADGFESGNMNAWFPVSP